VKRLILVGFIAVTLAACQSTNPQDYQTDHSCLQRKAGSKILSKAASIGLGMAGVPGGGLVGRGVAMATDPRCQAFQLTSDAKQRIARGQPEPAAPMIRPTFQPQSRDLIPNTVYTR
jgi:hypothetical protein